MHATPTQRLTPQEAEEYTQSLGQIVAGSWRQVAWAERLGIPATLGLSTRAWVEERLGGYIKMSIEDRREAVAELADEGLSQRKIADVLGVSQKTIDRDLGGESSDSPVRPTPAPMLPPAGKRESNDTLAPESRWFDDDSDVWEDDEPEPLPEPPRPIAHVGHNSGDNDMKPAANAAPQQQPGAPALPTAPSTAANAALAPESRWFDDEGLSQRKIADVLGVGEATVRRDIAPATNVAPPPHSPAPTLPPAERAATNVAPAPESRWFDDDADVWENTAEPEPPKAIAHVGHNSGDNEWYTPEQLESAITDLRRWADDGRLETISDAIMAGNTSVPPGEAGVQARYWLDVYDRPVGRNRWAQRHMAICALRSLHACAMAYWKRRGVPV